MIKKKWALWSEKKELDTATVALKFMSSKKVMEICVAMLEKINSQHLAPNTPLIHTSFTYPKLNMDEIYGLKFYLSYVHTSQIFLLKSLHAQRTSFLLLNLHF